MTNKHRTNDGYAMHGKIMSRQDSYGITTSQVKQRPPAPVPMVKAQAPTPPAPK